MIDCMSENSMGNPYTFTNFQSKSMVMDELGTAINALFPLARRIASMTLDSEALVYALSLSSSLINGTNLDTIGVFVALDVGELIDTSEMTSLFLTHITRQNSIVGLPTASSRSNALNFGEKTAYRLSGGASLALYACSSNVADNEISALCSVYWAPVMGR